MSAHVVIMNNGFECLHCAHKLELGFPVAIDDYVDAGKSFEKRHKKCKKPPGELCNFCHGRGHSYLTCPTVDGYLSWEKCRDTGLSSLAIMRHAQHAVAGPTDHPLDPSDFGRCYRLVKRFPDACRGVRALSLRSKKWLALGNHWDELTALYEEELPSGVGTKLYERMQALLDGAR